MPKGNKMRVKYNAYYTKCNITGTSREFPTEKELKTYNRRHDKFCKCGMNEGTGVVSTYGSMKTPDFIQNEL